MKTYPRTSTTKMEVTSIRLEPELKERLRELSGNTGYQSLIREVLWQYVSDRAEDRVPSRPEIEIRASIAATAQKEEVCAMTGERIAPQQSMWLGLTANGELVPLSRNCVAATERH